MDITSLESVYFDKVFKYTVRELSDQMRDACHGVKYDTIVGTGLSGTVFVSKVHTALRKNVAIVRKKNDGSHSGNKVEGAIGKRWVFVDDFMSSGRTFKRVAEIMFEEYPQSEFVGYYSYDGEFFTPAAELEQSRRWLKEMRIGPMVWGPETVEENKERYPYGGEILTYPAEGWSPEVLREMEPPSDVRVSWMDAAGRPTLYSSTTGALYTWDTTPKARPLISKEIERREIVHRMAVRRQAQFRFQIERPINTPEAYIDAMRGY
jgi:hypothetical protein